MVMFSWFSKRIYFPISEQACLLIWILISFKIIWIIIFVQLLQTVVLIKIRWSPINSHELFFQVQHLQKDPQL